MVFAGSYDYYVVIAIAFIQLTVLASLIYQIFSESRKHMEKEQEYPRSPGSSSVRQLEFDTPNNKLQRVIDVNTSIKNINEDEVRVLSFLLSKGGEAYQAEIARELGLPKSTVSRIIRRLYEKGLITVRRVSRFSYVQVTDMDYVNDIVSKLRYDQS